MGDFVMFSLSNLMEKCYSLFYLPLYLGSYLALWWCSTSLSTSKTTPQFPLEELDGTREFFGAQTVEQNDRTWTKSLHGNNEEYLQRELAGLTF